jgi:branched-chain amino acid transport system permease protein
MADQVQQAPVVTPVRPAAGARPAPRTIARKAVLPVVLFIVLVALSFVLPTARLLVLQNVLVLALFAVATNLLLGYGGLVSFGQAAFYGLGAYIIGTTWLHYHLPFWIAFVMTPFIGGVVALVIGALALRTRRLYFALLTLAFSQLFFTIAEKWYSFTRGDNGIFGPMIPSKLADPQAGFLFVLIVVTLSLLLLWKVVNSPFGITLRAIRENRERTEALGVNVYWHQLLAFVISGAFCAIAGALFVVHDQAAYPQLLDWTKSGDPVLAAVIGGMYTFLGPALGALIYQYGHDLIVEYISHWQLVLGVVLVLIVLFMPDGVAGLFAVSGWQRAGERVRQLRRWRAKAG